MNKGSKTLFEKHIFTREILDRLDKKLVMLLAVNIYNYILNIVAHDHVGAHNEITYHLFHKPTAFFFGGI